MAFLLVNIFLFLIVATAIGALLMYWWVRHQYRDVTHLFQNTDQNTQNTDSPNKPQQAPEKLPPNAAPPPTPNTNSLQQKLDTLLANTPQKQDIKNTQQQLTTIKHRLNTMEAKLQQAIAYNKVDLNPVIEAIKQLSAAEPNKTELKQVTEAAKALTHLAPREEPSQNSQAIKNADPQGAQAKQGNKSTA